MPRYAFVALILASTLGFFALPQFSSDRQHERSAQAKLPEVAASLNMSGAINLQRLDPEPSCSAAAAVLKTPRYRLSLSYPQSDMPRPSYLELTGSELLELELHQAGRSYHRFSVTEGGAVLKGPNADSWLSAWLVDAQGRTVFVNAAWTCPD